MASDIESTKINQLLDKVLYGQLQEITPRFASHAREEYNELYQNLHPEIKRTENFDKLEGFLGDASRGRWSDCVRSLSDARCEYETLYEKRSASGARKSRPASQGSVKSSKSVHSTKYASSEKPDKDPKEKHVSMISTTPKIVSPRPASIPLERDKMIQEEFELKQKEDVLEMLKTIDKSYRSHSRQKEGISSARPTYLAGQFTELYENEWREAFVDLCKSREERVAIDFLTKTMKLIDNFTIKLASDILQDLTRNCESVMLKASHTNIRDPKVSKAFTTGKAVMRSYRKEVGSELAEGVADRFLASNTKIMDQASRVVLFVRKFAELSWLLCIQDPPVEMEFAEKGRYYKFDLFKPYSKKGKIVEYSVWPALRLYDKGAVLCKGIAEGFKGPLST